MKQQRMQEGVPPEGGQFGLPAGQGSCHFMGNPFRTDMEDVRPPVPDGQQRVMMKGEAQLAAKPDGPEHAQGIFPKTVNRVAHTADKLRGQILSSTEQIHKPGVRIPGHGVDGEIPTGEIGRQIGAEAYRVRMPVIPVIGIRAKCCDLDGKMAGTRRLGRCGHPCGDGAVTHAGVERAGKQRLDGIRMRGGDDYIKGYKSRDNGSEELIKLSLSQLLKGLYEYSIGKGFWWHETLNGPLFWAEINTKWREYIK